MKLRELSKELQAKTELVETFRIWKENHECSMEDCHWGTCYIGDLEKATKLLQKVDLDMPKDKHILQSIFLDWVKIVKMNKYIHRNMSRENRGTLQLDMDNGYVKEEDPMDLLETLLPVYLYYIEPEEFAKNFERETMRDYFRKTYLL